jgi:uncharacterized membrane-anchored protein YhcB (DUF1043 family)
MNIVIPAWLKALIVVLVLAAIGFLINSTLEKRYQQGFDKAKTAADTREKAISLEQQQALTAAIESARKKEQQLNQTMHDMADYYLKEKKNAQDVISKLRSDVRDGVIRLSIATRRPGNTVCQSTAGPSGAATGAPGGEERAELDQTASDALISITDDGDNAIIERNELIDRYNAVRKACSGAIPSQPQE